MGSRHRLGQFDVGIGVNTKAKFVNQRANPALTFPDGIRLSGPLVRIVQNLPHRKIPISGADRGSILFRFYIGWESAETLEVAVFFRI